MNAALHDPAAVPRARRGSSKQHRRPFTVLALLLAVGLVAAGCSKTEEKASRWPEATAQTLAFAVHHRLPKMQQCWDAGAKRQSFLEGDVQRVRIDIKAKGVVTAAFVDPAHNRHPVGSCVRSAFDGLRFAPRAAPITFVVPLSLGAGAEEVAAAEPSQVAVDER